MKVNIDFHVNDDRPVVAEAGICIMVEDNGVYFVFRIFPILDGIQQTVDLKFRY